MKIVLLTHRYPLPEKTHLLSDVDALHHITKCWAKDGHEVHVVVFYQHQNNHDKTPKPFFYFFKRSEILRDGVHIHLTETRFISFLHLTSRIYLWFIAKLQKKRVGEGDITLVHFPSRMFNFASTFHPGKDKVAILHITDIKRFSQQNREGTTLLRRLKEQYSAIGFRSAALRRMYHDLAPVEKPEFLAMSGAPFRDMPPAEKQGGPMRVIYVGKLIVRKRADHLVQVLSKLKTDWSLTVVGEGELRGSIEAFVRENNLGSRVTLTGPVSRDQVMEYMRQNDVFVLQSYDETFGIVYLEAMAQRLICVGSRGEGIDGAIVDGENGFLVDARSDEELLSVLEKIAALPEDKKEEVRSAAYETARHMTEENMARQYLDFARQALEAQKNG